MSLIASCWLIIEAFLIPDGFLKWFYLSFYIHPIFLFACQIFLWLNYLSLIFLYIFKIISFVFMLFKNCVIYVFSSTRLTNSSDQPVRDQIVQSFNKNLITCSSLVLIENEKFYDFEEEKIFKNYQENSQDENILISDASSVSSLESCESSIEDENLNVYIPSSPSIFSSNIDVEQYTPSVLSSEDQESDEYSAYICSSLVMVERDELIDGCYEDQDFDEFYDKYTQRMGWFDVLNHDRTCGINAILKEKDGSPRSSDEMSNYLMVSPYMLKSKSCRKRVLRSIESDLELVYVAQSCLSWEALHHQYLKIKALASSNGVFYNNLAAEFQKFQVLLERFMEDEWTCTGKRVRNYVRARSSLKSLLQVPKVSGYFEQEREDMKIEGINVKEVLKSIERCIEAFWIFVNSDDKKPRWKFTTSLWTCPPVQDPRDLNLFALLTKNLHKKEIWVKDSEGKQKCWLRRVVKAIEEYQRKEILLTKIELKLISRVLQLPNLSFPQLNWCQQKLDNIQFHQGNIVRPSTCAPLFPP